jgi:hypothetical protein
MTKIKLSLENLRVESFATAAAGGGQGTVFGNAKTDDTCRGATGCGEFCWTYVAAGCVSAEDSCPTAANQLTECAPCWETEL